MIRELRESDVEKIRQIHARYYEDEFDFPDFFNNFICSFLVTNDNNDIVCAGGVRNIAESIVITNKGLSVRTRVNALSQALNASKFIAKKSNQVELHAFVKDPTWHEHLLKVGFSPVKGTTLVLEL